MKSVSSMLVSSTASTLFTFSKFRMGETVAWFDKSVPSITAHFNYNWWWFTKLFCLSNILLEQDISEVLRNFWVFGLNKNVGQIRRSNFSDLSDWAKDEAVLDYEAAHRRSVEVRVFEALLLACDWFVSPYDLPIETIFTGDWLNFYISIALTCCTHASVESPETSEPSW